MKKFLLFFVSVVLIWSCEETELLDPTGELEITEMNLPELPSNYVYEGWLLVGGTYVSVGTINRDSLLNNRAYFNKIEKSDLNMAEAFAITVENASSPAPSNYVLLVGDFNGNVAELHTNSTTSNGITTLGNKLSASYTLQNATVSPGQPGEYTENGIWFFKGSGSSAETTIQLEYGELRYQAWFLTNYEGVIRQLNMGIIASDSARDSRNAYTLQEPSLIPDFAGEDFLVKPEGENFPENFFPRNVKGSKVVITPVFNGYSGQELFPVILLQSEIPLDVTNDINTTYPMQLNTSYSAKVTKL